MFKKSLALAAACLFITLPSYAQQYVVNVHGIVCEFCSYGVAKNIRRLAFIDQSQLKEGVRVDIENQMVYLAVKDGATLNQQALFKAIKDGGYEPVKLWSLDEQGSRQEVMP